MATRAAPPLIARETCPGCAGRADRTLADLPYDEPPLSTYLAPYGDASRVLGGSRYTLLECSSCGMIWQRQVPGPDQLDRLYETLIDPDASLARDTEAPLTHRATLAQELQQVIAATGRRPADLRVLDFGMGWGRWLLMARGFGCQVWGSELSEARLRHAQRLAIPTLAWDEIPGGGFDVINASQVFEHLAEPYETLAHLARGLAPQGFIKLSVPPSETIHRRLRRADWTAGKASRHGLNAVAPLEHLNCFAGRSLDAMAARAGLVPMYVPLRAYYATVTPAGGVAGVARQLVKPVYRSVLRRGPTRFFRPA